MKYDKMNYERKKDLLIIIPAYNEAQNITRLLDELDKPPISDIADILIMNDASHDATNWIAKQRGYDVVTHIFNLGYGSGIQVGYKFAVRRNYRYVIQMDADGQHDPCNVMTLYKQLKTPDEDGRYPDIVLGSRFMKGSAKYEVGFAKKIAFVLFRKMIKIGSGVHIFDPTTGLQGLSRKAALYYSGYGNFDDKYPDANMILQMLLLGFKVEEIPAVMHFRMAGKSMHSGIKPLFYMMRMTISIIAVWFRIKVFKVGTDVVIDKWDYLETQKKREAS